MEINHTKLNLYRQSFLLVMISSIKTDCFNSKFPDGQEEMRWLTLCQEAAHPLSSVQSLSRVRLFATPWIAARQASLSITNSRSSLRLTSIESVMPSSHLILCRPLLLLSPIPPSIRVFSSESTLRMRWPKYSVNNEQMNEWVGGWMKVFVCSETNLCRQPTCHHGFKEQNNEAWFSLNLPTSG